MSESLGADVRGCFRVLRVRCCIFLHYSRGLGLASEIDSRLSRIREPLNPHTDVTSST